MISNQLPQNGEKKFVSDYMVLCSEEFQGWQSSNTLHINIPVTVRAVHFSEAHITIHISPPRYMVVYKTEKSLVNFSYLLHMLYV